MKQIEFCTGNKSKLEEANQFIRSKISDVDLIQNAIKFSELQSLSQEEILIDKMRQAIPKVKGPFIIDDTGIYFNKYKNFPGTLTKFVIKSLGIEGIKKLISNTDNTAYFKTTILYSTDGLEYKMFDGILEGKIVIKDDKIDNNDFPFSSIFIPTGYDQYLIDINQNNNFIDHRKKALDKLITYLKEL